MDNGWNGRSFTASLSLLYDETAESDRLFRDVAIKAAASHINKLLDLGEFVELCKENGEIGFDLLKASLNGDASQRQRICPSCFWRGYFLSYCGCCSDQF